MCDGVAILREKMPNGMPKNRIIYCLNHLVSLVNGGAAPCNATIDMINESDLHEGSWMEVENGYLCPDCSRSRRSKD